MEAAHGAPSAMLNATVHGFQRGFLAAAFFAIAASLVALIVLKVHKANKTDLDQEAETEAEALAAIPGV
jgi:phosphotransferase system HPr-like phosphotransfer protein